MSTTTVVMLAVAVAVTAEATGAGLAEREKNRRKKHTLGLVSSLFSGVIVRRKKSKERKSTEAE